MDPLSIALRIAIDTTYPKPKLTQLFPKLKIEGLTYEIFRNMVAGRTKPTPDVLRAIRRELKLPPSWPSETPHPKPLQAKEGSRIYSVAGTPLAPIKVVGKVSAGMGSANIDSDEGLIYVPQRLADIGGLGWVVDGTSMMPFLEPGDIAIFREDPTPRRRYAFLLESTDREMRVKILDWRTNEWKIVSFNPAYPVESLGHHRLLGFLIGWYRSKGSRETMDSDPHGLTFDLT